MRVLTYDPKRFDFAGWVREAAGEPDLSRLEAGVTAETGHSLYRTMEAAPFYERLEAALGDRERVASLAELYTRFVKEVIAPLFDEPIFYQARPTFRTIFADAAGEPRFHRDADYGHSRDEINYTVALTEAYATNAVWIESEAGKGDYAPIELKPGEIAEFDGANLSHGAVPNRTGRSRVSFDFRVIRAHADPERRLTLSWPLRADAHLFTAL